MKDILLFIGLLFSIIGLMVSFFFENKLLGYFLLGIGFICCVINLIIKIKKES